MESMICALPSTSKMFYNMLFDWLSIKKYKELSGDTFVNMM